MNAQQLVNMIFRTLLRKLVNKGVDAGIDRAAGGGRQGQQTKRAARHARKCLLSFSPWPW